MARSTTRTGPMIVTARGTSSAAAVLKPHGVDDHHVAHADRDVRAHRQARQLPVQVVQTGGGSVVRVGVFRMVSGRTPIVRRLDTYPRTDAPSPVRASSVRPTPSSVKSPLAGREELTPGSPFPGVNSLYLHAAGYQDTETHAVVPLTGPLVIDLPFSHAWEKRYLT